MTAPRSLSEVLNAVEQAREQVGRWETQRETRQTALTELEGRVGADALSAGDADRIADELARARAGVDVAAAAVEQARQVLVEAQQTALRAKAADLRGQAQALRDEADQRQVKTDALLAELSRWEDGATYLPEEAWMSEIRGHGRPVCRLPKTLRLRNEAAALEEQAEQWQARADGNPVSLDAYVRALAEGLAQDREEAA